MESCVRRLGRIDLGDGEWSELQTFASGKAQTGDDDDHDDLASETRPVFVFTGFHRNCGNRRMVVREDKTIALCVDRPVSRNLLSQFRRPNLG